MTEEVKRRVGRPPKEQTDAKRQAIAAAKAAGTLKVSEPGGNGRPKVRSVEENNAKRDAITMDELLGGLPATTLARIFGLTNDRARERLVAATPSAMIGGRAVYRIRDVARLFVKPNADDLAMVIAKTSARDLPPQLQKDFWAAQEARQKYEERAGKLWRSEVIQDAFMEVFKTIRMTMNLMADSVERETELSGKQRAIVIGITDDLLAELSRKLLENPDFAKLRNSLETDGLSAEEFDMEQVLDDLDTKPAQDDYDDI